MSGCMSKEDVQSGLPFVCLQHNELFPSHYCGGWHLVKIVFHKADLKGYQSRVRRCAVAIAGVRGVNDSPVIDG